MAQFNDTDKRRIRFQTRRGLLELDIVLQRFMSHEYDNLTDDELAVFVEILALEDQPLLAIINQYETSPKVEFEPLLAKIRGTK